MSLDSPKLKELLKQVESGSLQLPDFQREWKWDDERIRALIATVTLNYPLGVVMSLQTGGATPFKPRPLSGAQVPETTVPDLLLLDGQQRMTSLYQALRRDQPVDTVDARGKDLRRWYYIDIAKAIGSPSDRDEAIVSVPEDRTLRRNFAREIVLDLSTTELECAAAHFPLNLVFDTPRMNAWHREFVKADEANWEIWSLFEEHVLNHVQSFDVPMINLKSSTTMDAVCAVFERVNTGGVPLNVFELLTATYMRQPGTRGGDRGVLPPPRRVAPHQVGPDVRLSGARPDGSRARGRSEQQRLPAVDRTRPHLGAQAGRPQQFGLLQAP